MNFWTRLRFGYERDLDERAHAIALRSYRDALIVTFLLALIFPTAALALVQAAATKTAWASVLDAYRLATGGRRGGHRGDGGIYGVATVGRTLRRA